MEQSVLFVDDDPEILASIKRILRKEEYKQYYVLSAEKALKLLEEIRIDVVISDLMMPETNGLAFLMEVKGKYPNTVRIILSGYAQVSIILSAIEKGDIFRYITKPWKMDSSAKKTIIDALEYNAYFRSRSERDSNSFIFSSQNVESLLNNLDAGCIVTDTEKKAVYISENMKDSAKKGKPVPEKTLSLEKSSFKSEKFIVRLFQLN